MDFWDVADKYGLPIALLLFGVLALYFDVVVSGARYRKVTRERDQLLRLCLGISRSSDRTAVVAKRAIDLVAGRTEGEAPDDGLD